MVQETINQEFSSEFDSLLSESFSKSNLKEGTIIKGIVSEIEDDVVIIDISGKIEGRINKREFAFGEKNKEISIGDTVEVYLEKIEDHKGECILSRSKARSSEIWTELEDKFKKGELIDGVIISKTKGGLAVDIGVNAFLPGSQIDQRPIRDITPLLNVPQQFRILKMDNRRSNIVVSRRAVLEEKNKDLRAERFSQLKLGDEVEGKVKALTDYGAFIDLNGIDSLLHSSDIQHGRLGHPSEALKIDQQIRVKIIKVDEEKFRVSVGLKQLTEDPWIDAKKKISVGDKVSGVVTNVTDYGVFIEVIPGVEGLAHRDSLTHSSRLNAKPGNLFARSQSVECQVLEIDQDKRRLSLGLKQLIPSPFKDFNEKNPVGTVFDDLIISNIKDDILFCNLQDEIDGAVFSSELSWEENGKDLIKKYKVGDKIKAKIISNENDKIALSIREAIYGNPFKELKEKKAGDVVTVTVIDVVDNGIKVRVGSEKGPISIIKKNELALRKEDCRLERFGRGDRFDSEITTLDLKNYKLNLSVRSMEEKIQKDAMDRYGSQNSGASLGNILSAALGKDKKKEK